MLQTMRPRLALLVLILIDGALLAPVWMVKYPPLVDYPNNLARVFVLAHLHDPSFHFDRSYAAHWGFYPYLAVDLALVGMQRFVAAELAGKLMLSLCLLAVPLAAWFFVRVANPGNDSLAFWSLLVAYNYFFFFGFLNMQLSIAVCLLALGLWLCYLSRPRLGFWLLLLLLVTALYFTHLFGFGVAGVLVAGYAVLRRLRIREMLLSLALFVPGACFYLASRIQVGGKWLLVFRPFVGKLAALAPFMEGYSPRLDVLTLVALAACAVGAWWRNPEFRWNHPWPLLAGSLFGLYWIFPESYGIGWPVDQRLLPFVFLLLPVVAKVGRRGRMLAIVALALFFARTANVAYHFVSEQPELVSLERSFSIIPMNARVLPVIEGKDDEPFLRPYPHFWAYGVIRGGWFSPYLFAVKGVYSLRIVRNAYTPDGFWDLDYEEPPDWGDVQKDYDYVWAYNVQRFSSELGEIGEVIYKDADLQVFRLHRPE
jgi:hypothetical protein